jgi:two-component system response regulator FixJ
MAEPVIHIIDDDEAIRDSLAFLLDTAGLQTQTYESAEAFLAALGGLAPGCVVTDLRMPGLSGLALVQRLRDLEMTIPVIVITGHGDVALAVEAMKAGVCDFLEKPFDDQAILSALKLALNRIEEQGERAAARAAAAQRLGSLSQRERQVLDGLVSGRANKVIAHDLGISPRTVEVYRANLMTKMQASSLSELVRMALLVGGF